MNIGELNFIALLIFMFFFSLLSNPTTTLQYLLTAELLWISLYSLSALMASILDDTNVLSLTLLFLVLSAVEISVGLILVAFQSIVMNSTFVLDSRVNHSQFVTRLTGRLSISKFKY